MSKQQAKNQLFSEITSPRWQEENNRQLFSVTSIDIVPLKNNKDSITESYRSDQKFLNGQLMSH